MVKKHVLSILKQYELAKAEKHVSLDKFLRLYLKPRKTSWLSSGGDWEEENEWGCFWHYKKPHSVKAHSENTWSRGYSHILYAWETW